MGFEQMANSVPPAEAKPEKPTDLAEQQIAELKAKKANILGWGDVTADDRNLIEGIDNQIRELEAGLSGAGQEAAVEKSLEGRISEAGSWEELYAVMRQAGEIQGSQQIFPAEALIGIIEDVRMGRKRPVDVTRSQGIREKVRQLLQDETQPVG